MTDFNIIVGVQSGDAIRELSKVQRSVTSVGSATQRTTKQLQAHANQYNRTAVSVNKFGKGVAQQAGYQIADFAVQVQNGTSALQAFGQQGSQMLAVFGPLGSVMGAVVAVGAALGTVLMKSSGSMGIFNNVNKEAKTALAGLSEETDKYREELALLEAGVDSVTQLQAKRAIIALEEALALKEIRLNEEMLQKGRNNTSREVKAQIKIIQDQIAELNGALITITNLKNQVIEKREADHKSTKAIKEQAKALRTELTPEMKRIADVSNMVGNTFESSFMSIIKGTSSVGDAFRSMAANIIAELYRIFVVKKITNFITGSLVPGIMAGPLQGPTLSGAPLPRFEGGGYTGRGSRSGGLDGRGGFMAMLHPNETVIDHKRGGGGASVIVQQTINVTTGVQQTVRNEIQTLLPQIAEVSKAAVLDARRRGGSFANAF